MTSVLVVASHPDDEILGCGATMAKHVRAGDRVHIAIAAEGITGRDAVRDESARARELEELHACSQAAADVVGAASLRLFGFPDQRMDTVGKLDIIRSIEALIAEVQPSIVYTHNTSDMNADHRIVNESVAVACRPVPGHSVRSLLFFEVPSSTEWRPAGGDVPFSPNWFVDVSDTLELKLEALRKYDREMRGWPHPRSYPAIEHLARWRGAIVGCEAAEAFVLGRGISR
ncbi:MAG: PIG-L deacetylase family protein [Candidatus Velthaea sp.]